MSDDTTDFRDRAWKLIYRESWKDGRQLRVNFPRLEIFYYRNTRTVEVYWSSSREEPFGVVFEFHAPPWITPESKQCVIHHGWGDALDYLRQQMVLDDLADV